MPESRILVVGAAGFLGTTLCRRLGELGIPYKGLDIQPPRDELEIGKNQWIVGSFLDTDTLADAMQDCDIVCHLACTSIPASSNESPLRDCEENLVGGLRLLDMAVANSIKRVIYLSSGGTVYGPEAEVPIAEDAQTNPICAYGVHKLAVEKYLGLYWHLHQLDYQILRVSNPYGEFQDVNRPQGAIAVFLDRALNNQPIEIWGDGNVVRDYIYADDVAEAVIAATQSKSQAQIYNIGTGLGVSLNEVVSVLEQVLSRKIPVEYSSARSLDVDHNFLCISRAKEGLRWQPQVGLMEGAKRLAVFRGLNESTGQSS